RKWLATLRRSVEDTLRFCEASLNTSGFGVSLTPTPPRGEDRACRPPPRRFAQRPTPCVRPWSFLPSPSDRRHGAECPDGTPGSASHFSAHRASPALPHTE